MKQVSSNGHILFELIVSLALSTIMITTFTIELIRMNQSLQLRRERYKMQTQLMNHILAYERKEHPLNSSHETEIQYDGYTLFLVENQLCIEWEVYSGEAKRVCNKVVLANTKWISVI